MIRGRKNLASFVKAVPTAAASLEQNSGAYRLLYPVRIIPPSQRSGSAGEWEGRPSQTDRESTIFGRAFRTPLKHEKEGVTEKTFV